MDGRKLDLRGGPVMTTTASVLPGLAVCELAMERIAVAEEEWEALCLRLRFAGMEPVVFTTAVTADDAHERIEDKEQ
jgi:hypothetical protein